MAVSGSVFGRRQQPRCHAGRSMEHRDALGQTRRTRQDASARPIDRSARTPEGQHTSQGRTPVPRDQASIRACEGALSWTQEEHRAIDDTLCAVESVDGAKEVGRTVWKSPSAGWRIGVERAENSPGQATTSRSGRTPCSNLPNSHLCGIGTTGCTPEGSLCGASVARVWRRTATRAGNTTFASSSTQIARPDPSLPLASCG